MERNSLLLQSDENIRQLHEVEDKILEILSSTTGNILENAVAVNALAASKAVSNEIEEKQKIAQANESTLNATRQAYGIIAKQAASFFFLILDLSNVRA